MSVSASPNSFAAISPISPPVDAPFQVFQITGQSDVSLPSHASSAKSSKLISTKASPTPNPRKQTILNAPPTPPAPAAENAHSDTISGDGSTPLHAIVADRVVLMTNEEATKAEHAFQEHGDQWYERSGLFDRHNSSDSIFHNRDRAFSAPISGVNLPSLNEAISNAGKASSKAAAKDSGTCAHKPTAKEWVADIDCVSGVLEAMLADDDRGAR